MKFVVIFFLVSQKMANYAQRKMLWVEVKESKPCVIASNLDICQKTYKFYDIKFIANSYVYRQVILMNIPNMELYIILFFDWIQFDFRNFQIRRIIGALCGVAEGKIAERDIYELITIPSYKMWDDLSDRKLVKTAPACGLYFIGLNYRPEDQRYIGPVRLTPRGVRIRSFVVDTQDQKILNKNETNEN